MRKVVSLLLFFYAATMAAQNEIHCFKGKLNGRTAFELVYGYQQAGENDHRCAGYMYYPNAKNPAPILVVGHPLEADAKDPNYDHLYREGFEEYQPDGEMTGKMDLQYYEVEGDYQFKEGFWQNPTTGKRLLMTEMKEQTNALPTWWPGAPATLTAPKREAYSFKVRYEKDENDLYDVIVDCFVNGKKVAPEIREYMNYTLDGENLDQFGYVTEKDINFDGIPDLIVNTGMTTHAQNTQVAYVWNPVTLQFYRVEAFENMVEPSFDEEQKEISTVVRDGYEYVVYETYKWKNGVLKQVSSKREKLFDDDNGD